MTEPAYQLVRAPRRPATPPVLDAAQGAVVEHAGGPLLVLAGPGTGKTTTLVESVVDRVERALAVEIADEEDRAPLLGDLETIPGVPRFW